MRQKSLYTYAIHGSTPLTMTFLFMIPGDYVYFTDIRSPKLFSSKFKQPLIELKDHFQALRRRQQKFSSVFGDEHFIFNAYAEFAGNVDAGFIAEGITGL